jgi:hypothetical protein
MNYKVTTTDPPVTLDGDALTVRIATFCKNQGITNDTGWSTAVSAAFNATNTPGLSAATRTFFVEFFTNMVHIG